ncbi:MAG TPA: alkaline phosphatase family protein [Polyangia bacterium]|nr:alkaline phosphatase family protein [Polyangia bacterium]
MGRRLVAAVALLLPALPAFGRPAGAARNAIIFVADGLRPGSLNARDTPTLVKLRRQGVFFANGHSVFPTLTTPNAAAIATGHQPGDTGDFANYLSTGFAALGSETPFLEDDRVLATLNSRFGGNFLGELTLLAAARAHGFSTAVVGKIGPALIQDVTEASDSTVPATIVIDDQTGSAGGVPLAPAIAAALKTTLGADKPPPKQTPNFLQQEFLTAAVTRVILPEFQRRGRPFVLVFWSRDPDVTQHNQKDGATDWKVGINGETSRQAVQNADRSLATILAAIQATPELAASTDLFVTSDHGFSNVRRDRPPGFVAEDIATHLGLPLFDPDGKLPDGKTGRVPVGRGAGTTTGNGLIGTKVIVAANGGTDLVYVRDHGHKTVADLAAFLLEQDYVDAVFAAGPRGSVPGALALADVNLDGTARTPVPSLVVALHAFPLDPRDPIQTQVDVSDYTMKTGQGMHGSFGRGDVMNTMIAFGPDFKQGYVDPAPAGNADLAPTLARVLGFRLPSHGQLTGRVLAESLVGGPAAPSSRCAEAVSLPTLSGIRTALHLQIAGTVRYLDAAQKVKGPIVWGDWAASLPCAPAR